MFETLEKEQNYFAKREGLKTEYVLLVRNEALRRVYTRNKDRLKGVMVTVLN